MLQNTYRNPWTGIYSAPEIADERHEQGPFDPDLGASYHGIRLKGAPLKDSIPPVSIWTCTSLTGPLVQLIELTEVFNSTPALNQYRVDYGDAPNGLATGMIWINVPDGTFLSAGYRTLGDPLSGENLDREIRAAAAAASGFFPGLCRPKLEQDGNEPALLKAISLAEIAGQPLSVESDSPSTFAADNYGRPFVELAAAAWYDLLVDGSGNRACTLSAGDAISGASGAILKITSPVANTARYITSDSADYSLTLPGHVLAATGCENPVNNGRNLITAVQNASGTYDGVPDAKYIEIDYGATVTTQAGLAGSLSCRLNADGATGAGNAIISPPLVVGTRQGFYGDADLSDHRKIGAQLFLSGTSAEIVSLKDERGFPSHIMIDSPMLPPLSASGHYQYSGTYKRLRGDGLSVSNDSTNGWRLTVEKPGYLNLVLNSFVRVGLNSARNRLECYLTTGTTVRDHRNQDNTASVESSAVSLVWSGHVASGDSFRITYLGTPDTIRIDAVDAVLLED